MSTNTVSSDPKAALWSSKGHGRSPTLQLRHTVDDKLMVGTHIAFLPFRSMLHRNHDDIVILSEEVQEKKLEGSNRRQSVSRSFVITNRHVYLFSLPRHELFAPASIGGCFQISELTRVCTVPGSNHTVLQFVNGVIAIEAGNESSATRVADILFSVSGIKRDTISSDDVDSVAVGSTRSAKEIARFAPITVPPVSQPISQSHRASSRQSVGLGSEVSSRGIDTVLRDILKSGDDDEPPHRFTTSQTQTDPPDHCDIAIDAHALCEDRASSPIATLFVSHQGETARVDSESDHTESTNSEFDSADVWKSLKRTPPSASRIQSKQLQGHHSSPSLRSKQSTTNARTRDEEVNRRDVSPRQSNGAYNQKGTTNELEQYLGVLSVYLPGLVACGIDSLQKLAALKDQDIRHILDEANINKAGHRMLMHTKIAFLHR